MSALQPSFQHQFNGRIWRMEIDPASGTLFLEIRHEQDKQVSFASVDLSSGRLNFDSLTTHERWLTGMEGAYADVLLLHGYQSEGSPVHKGVMAYNAKTGTELWSNYNWVFDHLTVNGPVMFDSRLQPRKLQLADIKTGATLRGYEPAIDLEIEHDIAVPDMLPPTGNLPLQPFGNMIHNLFYNRYRIVSLHALNTAGALSQRLYVMDGNEVIFEDLMNDNIQKLQPEAFVLQHNHLIYLKYSSQLSIVNL